jgi:cation transport ATPase
MENTEFRVAKQRIITKYEKRYWTIMLDIISVRKATHRHKNADKIKKQEEHSAHAVSVNQLHMLVNTRCIKNEPYTHIKVSGWIQRDGQKTNSSTKKKTETPANKRTEETWLAYSLFLLLLLLLLLMVVMITQTTKELYENTPNNVFEEFLIKFTHFCLW